MSSPRRRPAGGIRRPQVAGRPRTRADEPDEETTGTGGVAVDERSAGTLPETPAAAPVRSGGTDTAGDTDPDAGAADDAGSGAGDDPSTPRRRSLLAAPTTRRATGLLLAVTVLLVAAAAFFGAEWYRTTFTGSASNTALTDVGATAQVGEQVGEAITKVYSFDYARLQQAEDDARGVITPGFQPEFDKIFGSVKDLAPQQKAVVTATIPKLAVASIDGDRATVYAFVNQVIRRQADGGAPQEGAAAARLRVDAQFVDGRWKISAMTPA
ncbi:nuclear transport factor 2 family protein [Pseudonocardia sp. ICBG1293]|uniref:nuclear transport factor 2 family protein n=1 Tax=Pseudonocardia sp. ICBG1293 TaxID=2844382 RepID=UPI001CC9A882|nr:nuclear transport factor 2 family protein [Pseudonocardia sp. ICBG1293]